MPPGRPRAAQGSSVLTMTTMTVLSRERQADLNEPREPPLRPGDQAPAPLLAASLTGASKLGQPRQAGGSEFQLEHCKGRVRFSERSPSASALTRSCHQPLSSETRTLLRERGWAGSLVRHLNVAGPVSPARMPGSKHDSRSRAPGRHRVMAQVPESLPTLWETQKGSKLQLSPTSREQTSRRGISLSLCLSNKQKTIFKETWLDTEF